jgi:hypothetical protein
MLSDRHDYDALSKPTVKSAGEDRDHPRVLVFSQRNIFSNFLFRCPHHEFEDIICQIDSAEILAPRVDKALSLRYNLAKRLAWHTPCVLNPGIPKTRLDTSYDLFFAVCGSPVDLLTINAVENWRDKAKISICLVDELWARELPAYKYYCRLLAKFDYVMLYYSQSVKPLADMIGGKCSFLPPGIDSIAFCPYPQLAKRTVDVYSIGRRSEITHQALLKAAKENGMFYLHDSISGDRAINSREHRALFAEIAKRSRYFIVNPALIDRPSVRGNQNELGNRYFEGAACGAIMIGDRPENEDFAKLFDWRDAVTHLPYNSGDIAAVIHEIDSQPDRQESMRRNNVVNSLMRHDWVYRWEAVLRLAGLEPMPGLLQRKKRLERLAGDIEGLVLPGIGPGETKYVR